MMARVLMPCSHATHTTCSRPFFFLTRGNLRTIPPHIKIKNKSASSTVRVDDTCVVTDTQASGLSNLNRSTRTHHARTTHRCDVHRIFISFHTPTPHISTRCTRLFLCRFFLPWHRQQNPPQHGRRRGAYVFAPGALQLIISARKRCPIQSPFGATPPGSGDTSAAAAAKDLLSSPLPW